MGELHCFVGLRIVSVEAKKEREEGTGVSQVAMFNSTNKTKVFISKLSEGATMQQAWLRAPGLHRSLLLPGRVPDRSVLCRGCLVAELPLR